MADALSRREDYRPINFLYILGNKNLTDTIRKSYDKDDLFRDIAAYFCNAHEKIPLGLLSIMHWYSNDPRFKLLYFICEGERRLCIPRSPELILLIMHEPHDVLFVAHPGFTKVYKDITKLQYWPKMRKGIEKKMKNCHRC